MRTPNPKPLVILAALSAALFLAACSKIGASGVSAHEVATAMTQFWVAKVGPTVHDVSCPQGVKNVGDAVTCTLTNMDGSAINIVGTVADGGKLDMKAADKLVHPATAVPRPTAKDAFPAATIASDIATFWLAKVGASIQHIDCPHDLSKKPGSTMVCVVNEIDGSAIEATTTIGADGKLSLKTADTMLRSPTAAPGH